MKVNIEQFLKDCGLEEKMYPGKRTIKKLAQPGENKSHCFVADWRNPDLLRLDVKAGLHGKDLPPKELKKFPVSFQTPTYVEIAVNANARAEDSGEGDEEDEEDEEGSTEGRGSGGGGGKKIGAKRNPLHAFSKVVEGKIPSLGEVQKLVVMGKEIAHTAYKTVLESLAAQLSKLAVVPVNILAAANVMKVVHVAPGGRPADETGWAVKEGAEPYKPKDMFGVGSP